MIPASQITSRIDTRNNSGHTIFEITIPAVPNFAIVLWGGNLQGSNPPVNGLGFDDYTSLHFAVSITPGNFDLDYTSVFEQLCSNGFFKGCPVDVKKVFGFGTGISKSELEQVYNFVSSNCAYKAVTDKAVEKDDNNSGICEFCGGYDEYASRSPKHNNQVRCYSHFW